MLIVAFGVAIPDVYAIRRAGFFDFAELRNRFLRRHGGVCKRMIRLIKRRR